MVKNKPCIIERILWIVTLTLSIMLLISITSPLFHPHWIWIPAFFGLAYPYLAVLTLLAGLVMCFVRLKKAIIPLLIFVTGIGPCKHSFQVSASRNSFSEQEQDLKILTQNVQLFDVYDKSGIITRDSVLSVITDERPDVACFQEFYNQDKVTNKTIHDFLEAGQFSDYSVSPYSKVGKSGYIGMIIFSKFPIINKGVIKNPVKSGKSIFAIWCDMLVKGDTVRMYNVHLQSIGFTATEESLFIEKSKNNQELESKSKSTARKLKRAFVARSLQVDILASHIDSCKIPVFLAGDFNDTPVSHTYRNLRGNLNDAFLDAGSRGMGKTYNGPFPSFRIDYIFFPEEYKSAEFKILNRGYSDHFPVSCRFKKDE